MRNPIVRQIVARCHVADSNRDVIKYVISRLAKGYATYRTLSKAKRKALLRNILAEHRDNRKLYRRVMYGH